METQPYDSSVHSAAESSDKYASEQSEEDDFDAQDEISQDDYSGSDYNSAKKKKKVANAKQYAKKLAPLRDMQSSSEDSEGSNYNPAKKAGKKHKNKHKQHVESEEEIDPEDVLEYTYVDEAPQDTIEQVLDSRTDISNVKAYCIKWERLSHIHNTWQPHSELCKVKGFRKLDNFMAKQKLENHERSLATKQELEHMDISRETIRNQLEDYVIVERVIGTIK